MERENPDAVEARAKECDLHWPSPIHARVIAIRRLRRERYGSRSGERLTEAREHHEVGVERDPPEPASAERREPVLVLQASRTRARPTRGHGRATATASSRVGRAGAAGR